MCVGGGGFRLRGLFPCCKTHRGDYVHVVKFMGGDYVHVYKFEQGGGEGGCPGDIVLH